MDAYRINVKIYFEDSTAADPTAADPTAEDPTAEDPGFRLDDEALIPIFHRYIQQQALDEILIDVADYKHVPAGPGVMLIAHDANYSVDRADGELGLLYAHKRRRAGDFTSRLRWALRQALVLARKLEQEPLGLKIAANRLAVRINDRLLAPNDATAYAAVEPAVRDLFSELFAAEVRTSQEENPKGALGIRINADSAVGVPALLDRLEAPLAKAS